MERGNHTWSIAEAKARLSNVIERACAEGPQDITRHGRRMAVVVAAEEWDRRSARKGSLVRFLSDSPLRGPGFIVEGVKDKPRKLKW